jgi:hypothetical protein
MNTTTLIELKEHHSSKSEELRVIARLQDDEGLSEKQRMTLRMHERFVVSLDEAISTLSKPC